jgi:DNA-binding beta-propeller fold protein YncE
LCVVLLACGSVFWLFDSFLEQMVRLDFQQPHGPGEMDHSIAAVRRFVDVTPRGAVGGAPVHAGVVVDSATRTLFVSSPGDGTVLAVDADSGEFARTARGVEYPAYSSRLPSFEYSVYECASQRVFASGLSVPSGLALSADGSTLFVAEHGTGDVHAYEVASGALVATLETGRGAGALQGIAVSPRGHLFIVDGRADELLRVDASVAACAPRDANFTAVNPDFEPRDDLYFNFSCVVDSQFPNACVCVSFVRFFRVSSPLAFARPG